MSPVAQPLKSLFELGRYHYQVRHQRAKRAARRRQLVNTSQLRYSLGT